MPSFQNPILPGFYPDPSISRVGDDYYLVNSSFEYFPCLPIHHSRDLVRWRLLGHAIDRPGQLDLSGVRSSGGIYAPTLRHHQGRFYLITTDVDGIGNFILHSDNPAGPWSDPILVPIPGIDPSLLFHEGRVYLTASAPDQAGILLGEINLVNGALHAPPVIVWTGTGGKYPEGPHLYHKDGWFHLIISEGGTEFGHMVTAARSRDPFGPYAPCPHNPIFSHRSTDHPLQSTGHPDLVQDARGRWWMVFLAVRHHGYPPVHHLGRETCLCPVDWPDEGWPSVNHCKPLPLSVTLPEPRPVLPELPLAPVRDDFDAPSLAPVWNFRRNPPADSWSLARRPGHLSLRCHPVPLDEVAPIAFIGQRQRHFHCQAEALLDFAPKKPGEEAGLVAIMNEHYYAALLLTRGEDGLPVAIARQKFGDVRVDLARLPLLHPGPFRLRLRAETARIHLEIHLAPLWRTLATVETRHLSTEISGGFTGVYLGLHATSNQQLSDTWVEADWFDYAPA